MAERTLPCGLYKTAQHTHTAGVPQKRATKKAGSERIATSLWVLTTTSFQAPACKPAQNDAPTPACTSTLLGNFKNVLFCVNEVGNHLAVRSINTELLTPACNSTVNKVNLS